MKKILYVLLAISTFTAGFAVFKARPLVVPISLVEASENLNLYYFSDIHIKAYLEALPSPEHCCPVIDFQGNYTEGAGFDLNEGLEKDERLRGIIQELFQKNREFDNEKLEKGEFVAEVIIVGKLRRGMGCFGPKFYIEAKEVKQISPIRFISREEFQKYKIRDED